MRNIIILENSKTPGVAGFRYVMRAAVPAGREKFYANPSATSAFKDATPEELAELQAGTAVERVETSQYVKEKLGDSAFMQTDIIEVWKRFQAEIDSYNPWSNYGLSWDGSTWTAAK